MKNTGADMFSIIDSKNDFELTNEYIKVINWNNRELKFDCNGKKYID